MYFDTLVYAVLQATAAWTGRSERSLTEFGMDIAIVFIVNTVDSFNNHSHPSGLDHQAG